MLEPLITRLCYGKNVLDIMLKIVVSVRLLCVGLRKIKCFPNNSKLLRIDAGSDTKCDMVCELMLDAMCVVLELNMEPRKIGM